jgi:hypothetical protein
LSAGVRRDRRAELYVEASTSVISPAWGREGTSPGDGLIGAPSPEGPRAAVYAPRGESGTLRVCVGVRSDSESETWLSFIREPDLLPTERSQDTTDETDRLCALLSQSVHTANEKVKRR